MLWFYADFRTAPTDLTDLKGFLTEKILKYYEKVYAEPLRTDLSPFSFDVNEPSLQRALIMTTSVFVLLNSTPCLYLDDQSTKQMTCTLSVMKTEFSLEISAH
jgi:hypothetical protein